MAQLHDALLPAFPDMELPLEDFVAEGEKVLVRLRVKGTHTGAFGDMPATGRAIDIGVLDLFQIRDDTTAYFFAGVGNGAGAGVGAGDDAEAGAAGCPFPPLSGGGGGGGGGTGGTAGSAAGACSCTVGAAAGGGGASR